MHYGELKTEVFQAFREVGNVIVFCLLIEQELVSLSLDFVMSAQELLKSRSRSSKMLFIELEIDDIPGRKRFFETKLDGMSFTFILNRMRGIVCLFVVEIVLWVFQP